MKKFFGFLFFLVILFVAFFNFSLNKKNDFTFSAEMWKGGKIQVSGTQILKKDKLILDLNLNLEDRLIEKFADAEDEIAVLLVLERFFDQKGIPHTINNEYYSTHLTPAGKPIEFSESEWGAPSKFNTKDDGLYFTTPIDNLKYVKIKDLRAEKGNKLTTAFFSFEENLNQNVQGLFRPRIYFFYNQAGNPQETKANPQNSLLLAHQQIFPIQEKFVEKQDPWSGSNDYALLKNHLFYLPTFERNLKTDLKLPAVLFATENSQGSRGIEAIEDSEYFKISTHEINQSKLVLPPNKYSLNPALPLVASFDTDLNLKDERIPLVKKGFIKAEIHLPNGQIETLPQQKITDFSVADEEPFQTGEAIAWRTVKTEKENSFDFKKTGEYKVILKGKVYDEFENEYQIGGTYPFYIGKKLTFSSAVKPGTPFFVGDAYFPRFAYFPSFKGEIKFDLTFYPFDKTKKPVQTILEKKDLQGGFGSAPIFFEEAGEYHVEVFAHAKHFMMGDFYGTYVGGALVMPRESQLDLKGKKGVNFSNGTQIEEPRFVAKRNPAYETRREFYFPYYSGDLLKIAAHENNSINPQVEVRDLQGKKIPIVPRAEGNLHPFNYPEKIEQNAYLFITSEKAGLIARNFVGSEYLNHALWNVTNQSFGGRINASKYGDLENDVYRNFASVYFEDKNKNWQTDHHVSNITVTARDAENDRIVAPFSEDFVVTRGVSQPFVIGTGMQKTLGANFSQYLHVFPAVGDIKIQITLTNPNGSKTKFLPVYTDEHGFTPVGETHPLETLGVWHVQVDADYQGVHAQDAYKIFVISEETKPLKLGIPSMSKVQVEKNVLFKGKIPQGAENVQVDFEVITPGAVLDSNEISICDFQQNLEEFEYIFDFKKINSVYKNFEIKPLSRMAIFYFHLSGELNGENFYKFGTAMLRADNLYDLGILPEH